MFRAHCLHGLPLGLTLNPLLSAYPSQALTRMHSLSSGSEHCSLLPTRPLPSPRSFAFLAPSTLASVSSLPPNATPFSYSPLHFPTPVSLRARLHPLSPAGVHPISLFHAGAHQWSWPAWCPPPGSRASRAQIGHLAPAFAGSPCARRISRRRTGCLQERRREDP